MFRLLFFSMLLLLLLTACGGGYKSQEIPFRPPAAYSSMKVIAGAQIAAEAYVGSAEAKGLFGFDIRRAGLLPVQVVIDNAGEDSLEINPDQTFLVDASGNYWNLLDNRSAYRRVAESSEFAQVTGDAGKSAFWGALGGAVVGSAIAFVGGEDVGKGAGKGAAIGGAFGSLSGGAESLHSSEAEYQVSRDLGSKAIENRPIRPGELGRGFLFFPGEAKTASQLRLQIEAVRSGKLYTLILTL